MNDFSPLYGPSTIGGCPTSRGGRYIHVNFFVFTTVTMKNEVFWVVITRGSCDNRRFGETYRFHHQGDKSRDLGTKLAVSSKRRALLATYCYYCSYLPILVTLMMEATRSSETSVLTRTT
jgi:hypothetical protein